MIYWEPGTVVTVRASEADCQGDKDAVRHLQSTNLKADPPPPPMPNPTFLEQEAQK